MLSETSCKFKHSIIDSETRVFCFGSRHIKHHCPGLARFGLKVHTCVEFVSSNCPCDSRWLRPSAPTRRTYAEAAPLGALY